MLTYKQAREAKSILTIISSTMHRPSRKPDWFNQTVGVCSIFGKVARWKGYRVKYGELKYLINDWPMYSGNHFFPVPDDSGPEEAYINTTDKWFTGLYAARRRDMVSYLLDRVDEIVQEGLQCEREEQLAAH